MKNIIWIFMLFTSCSNIKGQHTNIKLMEFQYVGENDKPIPSLLMATNKSLLKTQPWQESILVSEKTLCFIEQFIKKNNTGVFSKDHLKAFENMAFKIDMDNNEYGFIKRKQAFILFTQLKKKIMVEGNIDHNDMESIKQYLDKILPRMDW